MTATVAPIRHPDRLFIGGAWVTPSSEGRIEVLDSGTEELYFTVPAAEAADIERAVSAARTAFAYRRPRPRPGHGARMGFGCRNRRLRMTLPSDRAPLFSPRADLAERSWAIR
ncbi:hypothetical protein OG225_17250 [Nocardia sp. NBC_01377]|uniref:hypothetical protein n=1 Tax=Nocardia sp. NBC_01377 TaxID=2903595 RepID=UPI0032490E38